jgi:hypothetical protein
VLLCVSCCLDGQLLHLLGDSDLDCDGHSPHDNNNYPMIARTEISLAADTKQMLFYNVAWYTGLETSLAKLSSA